MPFLLLPRGEPELEVGGVGEATVNDDDSSSIKIRHKLCQGAHWQGKTPEGRVHARLA